VRGFLKFFYCQEWNLLTRFGRQGMFIGVRSGTRTSCRHICLKITLFPALFSARSETQVSSKMAWLSIHLRCQMRKLYPLERTGLLYGTSSPIRPGVHGFCFMFTGTCERARPAMKVDGTTARSSGFHPKPC
jgi:hypothetical protein